MSLASRVFVGNLSSRANEDDIHKFFKSYGHIRDISLKNGFGFVEFDDRRDAEDAADEMNGRDLMGNKVTVEMARMRGGGSSRGMSRGGFGGRGGDRYDGGRGGDRYDGGRGGDRYEGGRGGDRYDGGGRFGGGDRGYGGSSAARRYAPPNNTEYRVIVENLSSRTSWQDLKDFMRQAGEVTFADANRNRPGEGLVCFASRSDMKKAIEKLNGKEMCGRALKLIDDYHGGGGRSHSRSRSRSVTRSRSRSRSVEKQRNGARDRKEVSKGKAKPRSPSPAKSDGGSRSGSGSVGSRD